MMNVTESLNTIKRDDKQIGAFLHVFDDAKEQEEKSQKRISQGQPISPIDGWPIGIKDALVMDRDVTTAGSKILENFESPYTATSISKIIKAGGIIVGKTNLDEFAMGSSTEHSAYKLTKNPTDTSRVPGGSSGGSAAAVAAGMVRAALGSDTGGSIRQPAAFCGIVGFKPSYGTVSRYGLIAMGSSLDVVGPMANNVTDTQTLYSIISGQDEHDATSRNPDPIKEDYRLEDIKIGIPSEFFGEGLDPKIKAKIEETIDRLKSKGTTIVPISLPTTPLALSVYYVIMPVEVSSNLARFDGIKYGFSVETKSEVKSLLDVYLQSRSQGLGPEPKRRIMLGTYASSAGYADQYYNHAQKVRGLIITEYQDIFKTVDTIITPVTPNFAWKFGAKNRDPLTMYLEDIYTVPANIAGIPALSLPVGTAEVDGKKLPVNIQLLGPSGLDYKVLRVGKLIEDLQ